MKSPYVETVARRGDGSVILGPDGTPVKAFGADPVKRNVRHFWVSFDEHTGIGNPSVPDAVLLGATPVELNFVVDSQGHFDWTALANLTQNYQNKNLAFVEFFDDGERRKLQNKPVHIGTVFGTGRRPFRLPDPYLFNVGNARRTLRAVFRGGEGTYVTPVLIGRRYYTHEAPRDSQRAMEREIGGGWRTHSYFLAPEEVSETGGGTTLLGGPSVSTVTFRADNDAHTDISKLMAISDGDFSFMIFDGDTGRALMNRPIHNLSGWGTGQFPFTYPGGLLIEASKFVTVRLTNLSVTQNVIYLTMAGRRLELR